MMISGESSRQFYKLMGDSINNQHSEGEKSPSPARREDPALQTILALNRLIAAAVDEKTLIREALQLLSEQAEAVGAAYVPLDSNALPLEASFYGEQPAEDLKEWVEYLASPRVHGKCRSCRTREAVESCPLLKEPFEGQFRLYCFPLQLGTQEYGLVTLFRKPSDPLTGGVQRATQLAADQLALALENLHLRTREQQSRTRFPDQDMEDSFETLIKDELEHARALLGADFVHLTVRSVVEGRLHPFHSGSYPVHGPDSFEALSGQVLESGRAIFSLKGVNKGEISLLADYDLMAEPLPPREGELPGVLLAGKRDIPGFNPSQIEVFQGLTRHFALVIQNLLFLQEIKYRSILDERSRLAREIHDGLAQTLGYLKLQNAQLQRALGEGELETLDSLLEQHRQVIFEAYHDAREAIDGLQIDPGNEDFSSWVNKLAEIFAQSSGWDRVRIHLDQELEPPPEIQVQLIRIVQEAFSNIRKHADASAVEVIGRADRGGLFMEIRDDGRGFSPEELEKISRHGLQGMRERAALIAADLHLESSPGAGTAVRLSWHPAGKGSVHHGS